MQPVDIDGVLVTLRHPMIPFDGRWHRWMNRELCILTADGGWAMKRVPFWRWVIRYGGAVPKLLCEQADGRPSDHAA